MDTFPFTKAEWQKVKDASLAVVNASLAKDDLLRASNFEGLLVVLEELRNRYGEHPILLETEADFEDDFSAQTNKYRLAIQLAENHALPTFTMRISLARLLLQDFNDPIQAAGELELCSSELSRNVDDSDKKEWTELMHECKERIDTEKYRGMIDKN
jgi:hypothetical protein